MIKMKANIQEWKIIWYFFRSYKLQSLVVLAVMLVSGFFEMLNLAALYPVINYGLNLEKKNFVLESFEKTVKYLTPDNPFMSACILLIIVSVLAIIFKFIYNYFSNKLMIKIVGDTQKRIFEKFITADYNFYVKNQQGELIYSGTVAPGQTSGIILSAIRLVHYLINSLFLFSLLVLLSWQATLLVLSLGALYGAFIKKIMEKIIYRSASITVEENRRKNVILNELITGIKSIKIFRVFNRWKEKYVKAVDASLNHQFRMLMGRVFPESFIKFLFYVLLALAGVFLSQRPHGEIIALLPVFGTFAMVVNRFLPSAQLVGNSLMIIAECMPGTKIVHRLCREEIATLPDGDNNLEGFADKITFENLGFKYDNMTGYLLKDLSFSIERRKMTAIVGPSGSGKTTIINLLLKLYRPDKGSIKIDGVGIFEFANKSYLAKIGYVSQETFIFNSSFKDNIRFGMESCTDQMIQEAAKLANAHEFIMDTKDGYETIVGDAGIKLSGGQRQRVAIARAMLKKPEIIVFDEATSSLDNISEKKIQEAINNISKYATVLVIAHRLSTVQNADKIIILEKGEIKEQGTHQELLKNKNLYYHLYTAKDAIGGEFAGEKIL